MVFGNKLVGLICISFLDIQTGCFNLASGRAHHRISREGAKFQCVVEGLCCYFKVLCHCYIYIVFPNQVVSTLPSFHLIDQPLHLLFPEMSYSLFFFFLLLIHLRKKHLGVITTLCCIDLTFSNYICGCQKK